MKTHAPKQEARQTATNLKAPAPQVTAEAAQANDRPGLAAQRQLAETANSSPPVAQLLAFSEAINSSPRVMQQRAFADEVNSGPRTPAPIQQAASNAPAEPSQQPRPNNTGLPDQLKSGIESLSGMSMDNVRVQTNSSRPAQLNALAYTQGRDIHVAPGQEKHLPHEAWHAVQQAQGRVKPTTQLTGGVAVNDDAGLEREADLMGAKAATVKQSPAGTRGGSFVHSLGTTLQQRGAPAAAQRRRGAGTARPGRQTQAAAPTVQRVTEAGLVRGTDVIVTNADDPRYKKIGKVFKATDTGYEVRFGRDFVNYDHADLDVAVRSELDASLTWSAEEMEGLDNVAFRLVSLYPPTEYAYISLGSSPLLVIEYVRQRFAQNDAEDALTLLTLPISEVDDEAFLGMVNDILSGNVEKLNAVETSLERLDTYMMRYVSPQSLEGKKPLLIDFAAGGRTLTIMRYHVMAFYSYLGYASLARSVETVALNGGRDVISPTSSYRDLLRDYSNRDQIYDLLGQSGGGGRGEDLRYPDVPAIDPDDEGEAFLSGLANRKLKDEFGYRSWDKTSYSDVLRGRATEGRQDDAGIARARRAVTQIIRILDNF